MSAKLLSKRVFSRASQCYVLWLIASAAFGASSLGQSLPPTEAESLTGHGVVLAQAVRGHVSLIIAGFSHEAGSACEAWSKAVHADAAMASVAVYQAVMLEQAPGFVRGMIKSSMRKQIPAAEQDNFLVFTQDEKLWRGYFGVTTDKEPWVVLLDASGKVLWHGHGPASTLEPLVRASLQAPTGHR